MSSTSVVSIIIQTYMTLPEEERDPYLEEIRLLCDSLSQSKYENFENFSFPNNEG